jgi:putative RecB family exonuclease
MALPVPRSLSPSKVSSFKDCALAFRFSVIDRLPEPPAPHMVKGTLVHSALEGLFWDHGRGERTRRRPRLAGAAWGPCRTTPSSWRSACPTPSATPSWPMPRSWWPDYFRLEDPDTVDAVGVELLLEADVGGLRLRGIIDRLDVTPDGEFIVVDYKTGRTPSEMQEHSRLGGVQFYALLCEQVLGRVRSA